MTKLRALARATPSSRCPRLTMPSQPEGPPKNGIYKRIPYVDGKPYEPIKPTKEQYDEWNALFKGIDDNINSGEYQKVHSEIVNSWADMEPREDRDKLDAQFLHYKRMKNLERLPLEQRACMDSNGIYVGPPCPFFYNGEWIKPVCPPPNY